MKKLTLSIAAVVLICTACERAARPNQHNPQEVPLSAAPFEVVLLDHERGYARDSVYCFEGVWKDGAFRFGLDRLDPMVPNILPDGRNRLEFRISSEAAGFQGVNASSSSRCINIVQDGTDHTRYHLEWVDEGESTISFWNGEGATRREITFKATSHKEIPMEGITFRYDGVLYKFHKWIVSENFTDGQETYAIVRSWDPRRDDLDYLPVLEIVGPVPLNATEGVMCLSVGGSTTIPSSDSEKEQQNGKHVSLEDYNTRLYSGFRWFPNTIIPDVPDEYKDFNYSDIPFEVKKKLAESTLGAYQRITPTDLRERRVKIWKNSASTFTSQNISLVMGLFDANASLEVNDHGDTYINEGDIRYSLTLK